MKFRFINIIVAAFLILSTSAFSIHCCWDLDTSIIKIVFDKVEGEILHLSQDAINSLAYSATKPRIIIILFKKNRDL